MIQLVEFPANLRRFVGEHDGRREGVFGLRRHRRKESLVLIHQEEAAMTDVADGFDGQIEIVR